MKLNELFRSRKGIFFLLALAIFFIVVNQMTLKSMFIGFVASVAFFLIGGHIVGVGLFKEKEIIVQVSLGALTLLTLMGFMGWFFIIFSRLGATETAMILGAVFVFLLLVEKRKGKKLFGWL